MTADTNTAFGEEVVLLDARETKKAKLVGTTVTLSAYSSVIEATPTADASWNIVGDDEATLGARLKSGKQVSRQNDHYCRRDDRRR